MQLCNKEDYQELWVAVLKQAIEDLQDPEFRVDSYSWFFSDEDSVGSFVWICDYLRLKPDFMRNKIFNGY